MAQCVTAWFLLLGDTIRGREHQVRLGQVQVTKTRLCPQGTLCSEQARLSVSGVGGEGGGRQFPLSPMERGGGKGLTWFQGSAPFLIWFALLFLS